MVELVDWPDWTRALVWTALALGVSYVVGQGLRLVFGRRLTGLARRTPEEWDDVVVAEIGRRLPFWIMLVALYLVLPQWSLEPERHGLIVTVLRAVAVASVTVAAAAIAGRFVAFYGARVSPATPVSALTQNVVRGMVLVLGGLVVVGSFGLTITPYLTALGVTGLAVALALQDPLSNFFAGVAMGVAGQVRIGDYVRLSEGVEGYVADFNWRTTTLRTLANPRVIVPNSKLAQSIVTRYAEPEFGFAVDLVVRHDADLDLVERETLLVAQRVVLEVEGAVRTATPAVRFHTFGPAGITFSVGMRARAFPDQFLLKHEFLKRVHARYAELGIPVPSVEGLALAGGNRPKAGRPAGQ